jgi:hypothetical protein
MLPGLIGWADAPGATVELVDARGRWLARVGDGLTLDGARPLPSTSAADAAVCAADAARVVFAAPAAGDLVFALLDGGDLRAARGPARLPDARAAATTWSLAPDGALAAWNDSQGRVRYAVTDP